MACAMRWNCAKSTVVRGWSCSEPKMATATPEAVSTPARMSAGHTSATETEPTPRASYVYYIRQPRDASDTIWAVFDIDTSVCCGDRNFYYVWIDHQQDDIEIQVHDLDYEAGKPRLCGVHVDRLYDMSGSFGTDKGYCGANSENDPLFNNGGRTSTQNKLFN